MKKVLIIGNGSVGQALARSRWLSKYEKVTASRIAAGPDVIAFDTANETEVRDLFGQHRGAALVINAAAMTGVDDCEKDAAAARAANALGTKFIAAECARYKIPLIHLSTNYVFSGLSNVDYAESVVTGPCSIYGITKLEGEHNALAAPWCVVVRTSWIFGGRKRDFVNHFLEKMSAPGEVPVVGDQVACLTYAPDLADSIGVIAEEELLPARERGDDLRTVYHVTNSGSLTRYDMLVEMKKMLGKQNEIKKIPSGEFKGWVAVRPSFSSLSNARYDKRFSKPLRIWQDALKEHLATCAS